MKPVITTGSVFLQFLEHIRITHPAYEIDASEGHTDVAVSGQHLKPSELSGVEADAVVSVAGHISLLPGRSSRSLQNVFAIWQKEQAPPDQKDFLICSTDESVTNFEPVLVRARTPEEARCKYLRGVYSRSQGFREWVQDLSANLSFMEQFYLSTEHEVARFHTEQGALGTDEEIVLTRLKNFFVDRQRPDLGALFMEYIKTEDPALLGDDLYEFIALALPESHDGLIALDLEALARLD